MYSFHNFYDFNINSNESINKWTSQLLWTLQKWSFYLFWFIYPEIPWWYLKSYYYSQLLLLHNVILVSSFLARAIYHTKTFLYVTFWKLLDLKYSTLVSKLTLAFILFYINLYAFLVIVIILLKMFKKNKIILMPK
jgi:hypothetical protein